jgi:phospholipase C
MAITRRRFLQGAGAAGAIAATGAWKIAPRARAAALPPPGDSGIEHIVVVMMENRSFDHFLGWMPNADGAQQQTYHRGSATGPAIDTWHLAGVTSGCAYKDPDHSYDGGRIQRNGGAMDGWLFNASDNDEFALGYYYAADRPFMSSLALNYTALDNYHCSILAETYPNRFFMHAATTDRRHNMGVTNTAISPTIWDRLLAKNVPCAYYFSDLPFIGLWGQKYLPISRHYANFLADAASGTLPAVSFLDPRFLTETSLVRPGVANDPGGGTSNDDHPHGDIRAGDHFLWEIFTALSKGPAWNNTVLVINYDEWGGFFDHVAPTRAAHSALQDIGQPAGNNVEAPDQIVNNTALLGFRVPCIVASPWTKGTPTNPRVAGSPVSHTPTALPFDHTSVLKLIEWRHGLDPLTARDADTTNLGSLLEVFDFAHPDPDVPSLPVPPVPPPNPCGVTDPFPFPGSEAAPRPPTVWEELRDSGVLEGWNLPR